MNVDRKYFTLQFLQLGFEWTQQLNAPRANLTSTLKQKLQMFEHFMLQT